MGILECDMAVQLEIGNEGGRAWKVGITNGNT